MAKICYHCTCRATRDPAAPEAINQYDPIFAAPTGNFTPWQIHISPADDTFQHMFVVYATGKYITGPNENGGLCETVTFQQSCKSALSFMHTSCMQWLIDGYVQVYDQVASLVLTTYIGLVAAANNTSTCTADAPATPNSITNVNTVVQWSTDPTLASASTATGYRQVYSQVRATSFLLCCIAIIGPSTELCPPLGLLRLSRHQTSMFLMQLMGQRSYIAVAALMQSCLQHFAAYGCEFSAQSFVQIRSLVLPPAAIPGVSENSHIGVYSVCVLPAAPRHH